MIRDMFKLFGRNKVFDEQFERQLGRETVESELVRTTMLATFFAVLIPLFLFIIPLFKDDYLLLFPTIGPMYLLVASLAIMLMYELLVRFVIKTRMAQGKGIPEPLRYVNAFIETSWPSVMIIFLSETVSPLYALQSPPSYAYFIFIMLATLRLDPRLSVFTGAIAALEYALLTEYYLPKVAHELSNTGFRSHLYYLARSGLFLGGGVLSGFVGLQIKQRVVTARRMIEDKNRVISVFGQQVSQSIVDELLKQQTDIPSVRKRVCVMFLDIRNFTPLVEKKKPEEIVAYLNSLFGFIIEIVNRRHGVINQFLGDGFMATFGAPVSVNNDCQNAVDAALEIIARVEKETVNGTIPPTRLGIGLHAGEAVTGNVGSILRKQYSITGSVVVLASRIEQLTKEYQARLLVSEEVWQSINKNGIQAEALGPVYVKGREEPISIYKLA